MFADNVAKYNRGFKKERRALIITSKVPFVMAGNADLKEGGGGRVDGRKPGVARRLRD